MTRSVHRHSAAVVLSVVLQRLLEDASRDWSVEESLVLDALRRSSNALNNASPDELASYVSSLNPQQLGGVLNNVKEIYHELLFVEAENSDSDHISARLFEDTNHPGADVEFLVDGNVISEVQLKAVASRASILEHLERYPDIHLVATTEAAGEFADIGSSGFANLDLTNEVKGELANLRHDTPLENLAEGAGTSALVTAALIARSALAGKSITDETLRSALGSVSSGVVASVVLGMILN